MTHLQVPLRSRMILPLFAMILVSVMQNASAFDCELGGSQNFIDKLRVLDPKSCPTILDSSDKMFCCTERNTGINVCCNAADFLSTDFAIMIGVGIIVGILIACFVCCCCCPCCFLYKRRSQPGRVVTVQQPYQQVPAQSTTTYVVHAAYPTQPATPLNYQQTQGYGYQQPPPCLDNTAASAVYTKQAPYNPNF